MRSSSTKFVFPYHWSFVAVLLVTSSLSVAVASLPVCIYYIAAATTSASASLCADPSSISFLPFGTAASRQIKSEGFAQPSSAQLDDNVSAKASVENVIWASRSRFREALRDSGHLASASAADAIARHVTAPAPHQLSTPRTDGETQSPSRSSAVLSYEAGFVAPSDLSEDAKLRLERLAQKADDVARRRGCLLLARLPWVFAVLEDGVENGFPHTLSHDVICLPRRFLSAADSEAKTLILLHEKIHVFQKRYPDITETIVREHLGYVPRFRRGTLPLETTSRLRSNPDLNDVVYEKTATGCSPAMVYNRARPRDLADAHVECVRRKGANDAPTDGRVQASRQHHEHPYEEMAYVLSEAIVNADDDGGLLLKHGDALRRM